MKKLFKNNIKFIVGFVLGAIIFGSLCAYAVSVASNDVTYDNTNSGSSATTVKAAIDDLYSKVDGSNCKIINVYSAANDTVYYYNGNNERVDLCTTDASGRAVISALPKNGITLYSSVAKSPTSLSNPYSKTLTFNSSTNEIKVMPEGTIYWYGYKPYTFKTDFRTSGYNGSVSYETNRIVIHTTHTSSANWGGRIWQDLYTDPMDLSNYTKLSTITNVTYSDMTSVSSGGNNAAAVGIRTGSEWLTPYTNILTSSSSPALYTANISSVSSGSPSIAGTINYIGVNNYLYCYALWLE